jgi:hypothetical protein
MQYSLEIVNDDDPISPREWDNLGAILYSSSRYVLGDKQVSLQEMREIEKDKNNIVLPVYAYIHSGIALNTTGFSCPWDSGQSGIIYVSKEKIRNEFKVNRISPALKEKVINILRNEVDIYSQYASGEVYGYRILDENKDVVDSCYGFFSYKEAEEQGNESIKYLLTKEVAC